MNKALKLDRVSPDVYFAYEETIEGRAEFYDGMIVDMAGSTPDHSNIAANITAELVFATRGKGCKVFNPNLRIAVDPANSYFHPDVAVVCGDLEISDLRKDNVRNPMIVVEVLSPSTATRDRGEKFEKYQALESLREYVLVEQDSPQVYVYTKSAVGEWVYRASIGLETRAKLFSLDIEIPLANIYYDVRFEEAVAEDSENA